MLENIVAWVLNNYIGEYLENLNTDQLSVALLSGQVELENVPLKRSALRKLDLPIEVKAGLLGKLTLSVPITRLRSEPWVLKLSDVLVVIGPLTPDHRYDVEAVERVEQQKKEQMLNELEERHKAELLSLLDLPDPVSQDTWWGASLISTVLNNIQLILDNVHIRYEDNLSLPNGLVFNCGVRIQTMTMRTTNAAGKPGFIETQNGVNVFKKLELKGFSLYWNSNQETLRNIDDPKNLRDILAPENPNYAFIIHPCSAELRMERNSSKFPLKGQIPRFKFFLRPDKITMEMSRRQIAELRALNREWARFERARQHRKWRPMTSIAKSPKAWWRFAYDRVTDDARRALSRRSWHYALTRARHLNSYCRAYRRRLLSLIDGSATSKVAPEADANRAASSNSTARGVGSQECVAIMKQIEGDSQYSYDELHLFRETVFRRIMREKAKEKGLDALNETDQTIEKIDTPVDEIPTVVLDNVKKDEGRGLYGWITSFFTQEKNSMEKDELLEFGKLDLHGFKDLPKTFNVKEMEEEILDVLHESWDDSTLLRRDALLAEVAMRLEHITLRFLDTFIVDKTEQRRVLALDLTGVSSRVELSPRQHSLFISSAVHDMSVQRLCSGHMPLKDENLRSDFDQSFMFSLTESTKILLAVGRKNSIEENPEPVFRMLYRRRSPRLVVRHNIEVNFCPVSVMYEENALQGLSTLFSDDPNVFVNRDSLTSNTSILKSENTSSIESHVVMNLHIPNVAVELRRRKWSERRQALLEWEAGDPFACLAVQNVSMNYVAIENYVSKMKLGIGHVDITDLVERTGHPLLTTRGIFPLSKPLSASCPDFSLATISQRNVSSSLPSTSHVKDFASANPSRKISSLTDSKRLCEESEATLIATFVDSRHPQFESKYRKMNCDVDIELNQLVIGMNRRSWTCLIDFLGLLGSEETEHDRIRKENHESGLAVESKMNALCVGCTLRMRSWRVSMNYPANSTRLGVIRVENAVISTQVNLNETLNTLSISLLLDGLHVDDRTPFYSELYPERLVLFGVNTVLPTHAEIKVVKFLGEDASRECDLQVNIVVPETMKFYYVHTHRFFCGLFDFWAQFSELQDQVAKSKRIVVLDGLTSKILLNIDVKCPTTVVLPLNQCSDDLVVLESDGFRLLNSFKRMSTIKDFFQKNFIDTDYGYDTSVDCLVDWLKIMLLDLRMYEGRRLAVPHKKDDKMMRIIGREAFDSFEIMTSLDSVFSRRFDFAIDILRNLDGIHSHNVPDLSVAISINNLKWQMTSDFYTLLRGVIEKNFGDVLIPIPETIPIEILQKPAVGCEVGSDNKYATLSFRLLFDNVEINCHVPTMDLKSTLTTVLGKAFTPFASVQLLSARISLDIFIDGQSELDLVCVDANLIDTRRVQTGSGTKNLFSTILQPRKSATESFSLMFEAHIMMRKDEAPVITLVLMHSKLLMMNDWLNDVKNFVTQSIDFVPKDSNDSGRSVGVVGRLGSQTFAEQHTIALKITLRDSDLYFLENPHMENSFAIVMNTTAVLNVNESDGLITTNLEVQNTNIGWCCMQNAGSELNQCSNDFSITVRVSVDGKHSNINMLGLPCLATKKHSIEVEFTGLIGRLSYNDVRVFYSVVRGYINNFTENRGVSMIPVIGTVSPPLNFEIGHVILKAEQADFWLLDDFQGSSIPILRLSLLNLRIDRQSADRIVSSFSISADYFNQRVFGWEPFVEKWSVLRLLVTRKGNARNVDLVAESRSTLDINITEQLMQQAMQLSSRWPTIRESFKRDDFRSTYVRSRSDHLPYLFKNQTGCDVVFTTAVEDIQLARTMQRKAPVRWISVAKDMEITFEFPPRLLLYTHFERESPHQLIVRVNGWDEISPVNVDSCGTYFRLVKATKNDMPMARVVIQVTVEKDGKKLVVVRSSIDVHNHLPHQLSISAADTLRSSDEIFIVEPSQTKSIPLPFVHCQFLMCPVNCQVQEKAEVSWSNVRKPGQTLNRIQRLLTTEKHRDYWLCTSVRREHYPDHEMLPGHTISVVAPLNIQNLLPIDVEIHILDQAFPISAGKTLMITTVDITKCLAIEVVTDRMRTVQECYISKSSIGEGQQVSLRLCDPNGRPLDMYGNVRLETGGSISLSLWVPYWIVNKSGVPLILKQEAADSDAAGQMAEHERAKDKHPLMFSFADDGCPKQCMVRVGRELKNNYHPRYSQKFALTPGVQALKLSNVHGSLPTLYYNIGVEVRAGTGRYKDTQVVLLTSRYVINNQSSFEMFVCHHDFVDRNSEHVRIASKCSLVWNENYEDCRQMCVRRSDVKHWSCPFRIDRIGSFHVTMRDADETPRFVRVEIILNSAVFCVTFTDAVYYPPPIRIENHSNVPVLYQQQSESPIGQHLRTICKAKSHVDYAWDDLYGNRRIVLQVYENKSHVYDPSLPGIGPQLVYENHVYIKLAATFNRVANVKKTDECELVLETMQKGKVMLNKQNRIDGNSGNQLWTLCKDGCIENVGMSYRSRTRVVLDVLERMGFQLMMKERSSSRDRFQKWTLSPDGQLWCQGFPDMAVTHRTPDILLSKWRANNNDMDISSQVWEVQYQRLGSGKLEVECLHNGPTLVVRITDREDRRRSMSASETRKSVASVAMEFNMSMRAGIGVSLVNGSHEELIYARFGGIALSARHLDDTYQLSGSVNVIQVDNQLLNSDTWQVLNCLPEPLGSDDDGGSVWIDGGVSTGASGRARPALKLEMNCRPQKHYDAFDCFRLKLCDLDVHLNELLLWKLVQFAQASDAATSVQQKTLSMPPNTDLERPDPFRTRRWYFGTLDLEMGQIALSVVTVSKSTLPPKCRQLKQQFNVKLISFEKAAVYLPPFRQFHYFETSSFLLESLKKFYLAELQKQTLNIVVTLDAFGNPQGLVTDLKDSFQGLFIEGDLQRFVAGLGYGVSNSISKLASSAASGVGALTFDQEHEAKRRHNIIRSHSTTATPLSHLYSGVKGLGVGVLGGITAIFTNTVTESRKSGIMTGAIRGITTGAVDTVTKPVQGLFDLVEGTASAMKELAGPATGSGRKLAASGRIRLPRLCRNLYHLLPPYSHQLANAQMEMLRINDHSTKERLLDVEVCLEQISSNNVVRQYVLISTTQCYVCRQVNSEPSNVIFRIPYKYLKTVRPRPELENSLASLEVMIDTDDRRTVPSHIWCGRYEVARRLGEKIMQAKRDYDHSKRTLSEQDCLDS